MMRKNALLTQTDREWLRGEMEVDGNNRRQKQYQRRESIKAGLKQTLEDFSLLVRHYDEHPELEDGLNELFDLDIDHPSRLSDSEQRTFDGLVDMLVFVFIMSTSELAYGKEWAFINQPNEKPIATGDYHSTEFLTLLHIALESAYGEFDVLMDGITLEMEGQRMPKPERILRDLEEGREITPRVAANILRSGRLDMERVSEFFEEELKTMESNL